MTSDIVPEIDQNGVITMYEVLYVPLETFGGAIVPLSVNVTEPMRMTTLTDLQEYVNYTISVQAYTNVGAGPYSDGIIQITNQAGNYFVHLNKSNLMVIYFVFSSCQSS